MISGVCERKLLVMNILVVVVAVAVNTITWTFSSILL